MALCINNSGTYRNITTVCVNDSGTYRNPNIGCINDSGTYRLFLIKPGAPFGGGFLVCKASPVRFVVSPYCTELSRQWQSRCDAATCAQQVTGCTGWYIPHCTQSINFRDCKAFWGPTPCHSFTKSDYWTDMSFPDAYNPATRVSGYHNGPATFTTCKASTMCVRSFRCVTY